jgi:hypothetical protein
MQKFLPFLAILFAVSLPAENHVTHDGVQCRNRLKIKPFKWHKREINSLQIHATNQWDSSHMLD